MRRKRSKKRGPVQAKRITYDGINFASGLERYMYMALKKAKLKFKYEGETFELIKGEFKNRGNKKILNIKYTPDFVGSDFIIECKGRANESFPMRWKLFKKWITDNGDKRVLYKPQNQSECDKTVDMILQKRSK